MYKIIEIDGIIRSCICKNNKADKYGDPKIFNSIEDAQRWIDKHTYKGMSIKYEIMEVK